MNRTNENQFKATTKRRKKEKEKKRQMTFSFPIWINFKLYVWCFLTVHSYKMAKKGAKTINHRSNFLFFLSFRSHLSNVKLVAIVTIIFGYVLFSIINWMRLSFPFGNIGRMQLWILSHSTVGKFSFLSMLTNSIDNMFIFHIPFEKITWRCVFPVLLSIMLL